MPRDQLQRARGGAALVIVAAPEPEQLTLFPGLSGAGGFDLAQLRKERAAIAAQTRATNTVRGYDSDWRDFEEFCASAGRRALPASSDTVQLYLCRLAQLGRLPSTMARRAAAIASRHLAAGLRSPIDADVREVLQGMRRKYGAAPRHAKEALTVEELRKLLDGLPDDAKGARDRALLLVGFASGLRRSELVSIQIADIKFERAGAVIRLGRSKADQEGRGRYVGVHKGKGRGTCPIVALRAWLRERGVWAGPVFAAFDSLGRMQRRAMAGQSVADAVKDAARAAGLDPRRFGAHSLRAGLVTAAGGAGVGTLAIMSRTGHRDASVVQRYMRPAGALAVDPLAGIL